MATNRELKAALLKKLGITEQALNLRAQRRKNELPMSTEQAYYTIAHDEGLDLSRYLPPETVTEIRTLVRDLKAGQAGAPTNGGTRRKAKTTPKKTTVVKIAGMTETELPGMTTKHANEARAMSESVYPMLYLFENSLRDLIERVLKSVFGAEWWTHVPAKIQTKAAGRKADEKIDPWHGRRGNREIDYVDLTDLWLIIKDNWASFKPFFPSGPAWVESLITNDMKVSRRPLAHMNPLATEDVENVKNAFRKWTKLLNAIEGTLP